MEIIKLTVGENEDLDISFAEGKFSINNEDFLCTLYRRVK